MGKLQIGGLLVAGLALALTGLAVTAYAPFHEAGIRDAYDRRSASIDNPFAELGTGSKRAFYDRLPRITRALYRFHSTVFAALLGSGIAVVVAGLCLRRRRPEAFAAYTLIVLAGSLMTVSLVGALAILAYALPSVRFDGG